MCEAFADPCLARRWLAPNTARVFCGDGGLHGGDYRHALLARTVREHPPNITVLMFFIRKSLG